MTIWALAERTPDRVAVSMATSAESLTFAELNQLSLRIRAVLQDRGIGFGDAVAVYMENNLWYHPIYFAAMRAGLYLVPVNRNLTPVEAAAIIEDSGAKAVLASSVTVTSKELSKLIAGRTLLAVGSEVPGFGSLTKAVEAVGEQKDDGKNIRGAAMFYSSGTTGPPKGIKRAVTGVSYEEGAVFDGFIQRTFDMDDSTVYLCPGPLYHPAPLLYSAAAIEFGGHAIVMEKFDAVQALDLLERDRVTMSMWVPTMFKRLLSLPEELRTDRDLSAHRYALHAAAPCPIEVKMGMIDWWGPVIVDIYGASENYGITLCTAEEWLTHQGSIGRPILGIPHICDWDGNELGVGETGRLFFEQFDDGFEYLNDPDKTESTRHPQHRNWRSIGDIGYVDADGFLYLTDRESHMIITGGVNIYPQEIEDALVSHPMVSDAAIIGVPDEELGEISLAVLVLEPGVDPAQAQQALLSSLGVRFARYKLPRRFEFVIELPRHDNGKLYKGRLKAMHV